jgi:hypothetical protein
MDCQAGQLAVQPPRTTAPESSLQRDDDVPQVNTLPCRIGFIFEILLMKTKHIGGSVYAPIITIQLTYL